MAILSIQSQVASGYVGNSAAVFALQCLGREVWSIPTVLLSHHPGHGGAAGGPVPARLQAALLEGLAARGGLAQCDAVLSGYLGQAATAKLVLDAVGRAKAANSQAIYLCDPVLGDDGRLYVRQNVVRGMHNLAAKADIITPNAFELGVLSGDICKTRQDALQAMRTIAANPAGAPKVIILTSFAGTDTGIGTLDMMALDSTATWHLSVPLLARKFYGAGDLFAALFLNAWLPARDTGAALGQAASALHGVLALTAEIAPPDGKELALIEARTLLAALPCAPPYRFSPERMA